MDQENVRLNMRIAAASLALRELTRAEELHPPMNSAHEGYAVIKEELEELWAEIKKKESLRDNDEMMKEAAHVAATALRFLIDVCKIQEA